MEEREKEEGEWSHSLRQRFDECTGILELRSQIKELKKRNTALPSQLGKLIAKGLELRSKWVLRAKGSYLHQKAGRRTLAKAR